MSGPCSLPNGSSRMEYMAMWDKVCDFHKDCTPDNHQVLDKNDNVIRHSFIFKREWLAKRGRLTTGKTK